MPYHAALPCPASDFNFQLIVKVSWCSDGRRTSSVAGENGGPYECKEFKEFEEEHKKIDETMDQFLSKDGQSMKFDPEDQKKGDFSDAYSKEVHWLIKIVKMGASVSSDYVRKNSNLRNAIHYFLLSMPLKAKYGESIIQRFDLNRHVNHHYQAKLMIACRDLREAKKKLDIYHAVIDETAANTLKAEVAAAQKSVNYYLKLE
jgi:hypothetical protein